MMSRKVRKAAKCLPRLLAQSGRTMEDIYSIAFSREGVMAESFDGGRVVLHTFAEARCEIDRLAAAIAERVGTEGQFVALYAENCVEYTLLFWAILKSGNKPYLVNLRQPLQSVRSIMKTLSVEYVIGMTAVDALGGTSLTYAELSQAGEGRSLPNGVCFANELALTTSGTTLKEKICIYTGREISAQILNTEQAVGWNKHIIDTYRGELKMLMFLPLYHVFGLEASYLWFLFLGAVFVFAPNQSPDALLETVRRHRVTHIFAVPMLWHALEKKIHRALDEQDEKTRRKFHRASRTVLAVQNIWPTVGVALSSKLLGSVRARLLGNSIRFCISGGSYLRPSAMELINSIGYPLYNGYGMTEIGIAAVDFSRYPMQRIKPTIGRNFSSVEFDLREGGALWVRGESVCRQIILNGVKQESTEWFDTGDVVLFNDEDKYVINGRASDLVINESGENLNPDLAERAFALDDAECFTVTGDLQNERLWLIVQIPTAMSEAQRVALSEAVEAGIAALPPAYQIEKTLYTTDPLLEKGAIKVSRQALKRRLSAGELTFVELLELGTEGTSGAEESEIKQKLRAIFSHVLKLPPQAIDDEAHFMRDLGGNSLDYYDVLTETELEFGVRLTFEGEGFSYSLNAFEKLVKDTLSRL